MIKMKPQRGRPQIGHSRQVKLTLTEEQWGYLEGTEKKLSEAIRELIEKAMADKPAPNSFEEWMQTVGLKRN